MSSKDTGSYRTFEEFSAALGDSPHSLFEDDGSDSNKCKICGRGVQDHAGAIQHLTLTREEMHKIFPELKEHQS